MAHAIDQTYREELLELYTEKPNFGHCKQKTHEATLKNPSCNDCITIELEVEDDKIKDAKFNGTGCFVNTVAASITTENIKGKKVKDVLALEKKDLDKFLGMHVMPTRIPCALLPLEAIKQCLKEKNDSRN